MLRIDTHHHLIPPDYRKAVQKAGLESSAGRALPDWSLDVTLQAMAELDVGTAILSVSTPGTSFLPDPADSAALARDLNDYTSGLIGTQPERLGFFATVPMPHIDAAVAETVRALDDLRADGVVLLANDAGVYLGEEGQRSAVRRPQRALRGGVHPPERITRTSRATGVPPFAADFLLDTTRAAYLLVRNGIRQRYPDIKFILSHAGGFVPYASHRMAIAITGDTGRNPADSLEDFSSFYFDTALSSSAAALPTLLAFAKPGHITFGSDFPFAPIVASQYFAAELATYPGIDADTRAAIDRTNALALFPRFGG